MTPSACQDHGRINKLRCPTVPPVSALHVFQIRNRTLPPHLLCDFKDCSWNKNFIADYWHIIELAC